MGILQKLLVPARKSFTPADAAVNWQRIESLVHGPAAWDKPSAGDANSAVFACLMVLATAFTEPPPRVYRRNRGGADEHLAEHPWQVLLEQPTPNGEVSAEALWFWTAWAMHVDGNAYWLKVRSGDAERGNVVQLWPVSPLLINPVTVRDSGDWISYYRRQMAPGVYEQVSVNNIVHYRLGIDDGDQRLGLAPLKRLVRQISTDEEADRFVDALLRNYAVPGLIVTTQDATLDKEQADAIKDRLAANFSNDNRGKIGVLSNGAEVKQFGFSPKDLDLSVLHRIPEERISAALGVPAIVAGLGAGLERATYSNFKQAREMFTEMKMVPLWRSASAVLNTQLRADFASDKAIHAAFDLTDVRALQEDEDAKYRRLNLGVAGETPWIRVNEARADVGLPPDDDLEALQMERRSAFDLGGLVEDEEGETDEEGEPVQRRGDKSLATLKANRALLRAFPELLRTMVDLGKPAMTRDLSNHFDAQRRRLKRRWLAGGG